MKEGYKKTEIGVIPEDWEVVLLSDICEVNPKKDILENDDEVAFLPMEQVSNSGRIIKIHTRKYEEVSKGYTPFKNKDVLLAKITPCFENGKRAIVENLQYKMGFGSTEFHVLRSLEQRVMPKYLYYCIDTHRFKELAERNMTGSAGQKRVPTTFLKDFKLPIPPLKEQEKISEVLSTIDSQIDDTEKLIEKSKELKKGLMQKLLTKGIGHSEFKKTEVGEIPASWEVKKLEEVSERVCVGFVGSCNEHYTLDNLNGIPMIRTTNISKGILDLDDVKYVTEEFHNKNVKSQLKYGDILVARHGENGKACLYDLDSEANCLNIVIVRPNNDFILSKFLLEVMNSNIIIKQINLATVGSVQNVLNTKTISNLKVMIPCIKEQEKIADILSSVDNEIERYENKKQKLEELKKGLMQQLLTGKIRTV